MNLDKYFTEVPMGQINNIAALVEIIAWHRPGDKPLSQPMLVIYWRIYTSLGLNDLRGFCSFERIIRSYWNLNISIDTLMKKRLL